MGARWIGLDDAIDVAHRVDVHGQIHGAHPGDKLVACEPVGVAQRQPGASGDGWLCADDRQCSELSVE